MNKEYQEKIFSGPMSFVIGTIGVILLGISAFLTADGSTEDIPVLLTIPIVGLLMLLVAINFAFLTVKITPRGISACYGIFHHNIPAEDICSYYRDQSPNWAYGGFGIRFGWNNGKRRVVYNVYNTPRVVVQRKSKPDQEFVFSSHNPDRVMEALRAIQSAR